MQPKQVTSRIDLGELSEVTKSIDDIVVQLGRSSNPRFKAGISELRKVHGRVLQAVGLGRLAPKRPRVLLLCGPGRSDARFREEEERETIAGKVVIPVVLDVVDSDDPLPVGDRKDVYARLAELNKRKAELADEVLVISDDGLIDVRLAGVVEYARSLGKVIRVS